MKLPSVLLGEDVYVTRTVGIIFLEFGLRIFVNSFDQPSVGSWACRGAAGSITLGDLEAASAPPLSELCRREPECRFTRSSLGHAPVAPVMFVFSLHMFSLSSPGENVLASPAEKASSLGESCSFSSECYWVDRVPSPCIQLTLLLLISRSEVRLIVCVPPLPFASFTLYLFLRNLLQTLQSKLREVGETCVAPFP